MVNITVPPAPTDPMTVAPEPTFAPTFTVIEFVLKDVRLRVAPAAGSVALGYA